MSVGTPHTARVSILWMTNSDGQACENTFYLMDTSDAMFADPGATIDAVWTAWEAHGVPATDAGVQYNGVIFEDVRTVPFGGLEVPQTPINGSGGGLGSVLPSCTCKAIKKSTATLGRSGRGRWFFPITAAGLLTTGDTVAATKLTQMTTGLQGFQTALELALSPAQMGIVSYHHGGVTLTAGVFEQITGWGVVNNDVDTQRRRLLGHNRHR